ELLVAATLTQDASPAEDGVQRRAQFVGDQSNELVLRPVGALGLAARLSLSRQSLFESLLGLLAAGDINDIGRGANRISPLIAERDNVDADTDNAPVLAHVVSLGFILSFTAEHPLINGEVLLPVFRAGQLLVVYHKKSTPGLPWNVDYLLLSRGHPSVRRAGLAFPFPGHSKNAAESGFAFLEGSPR